MPAKLRCFVAMAFGQKDTDGRGISCACQTRASAAPRRHGRQCQISDALRDLTQGVRTQATSLDFTTEALDDVARDLRFKLGDAGIPLEDIVSSGLGYANLLYIATVIVELAKARDADLTLFLVEEPEAHLHPQLQMLMLDFLLLQANKSAQRAPVAGKPGGRIQIVVTTHSPSLTAWVGPEHIVVVRSDASSRTP
jgi:putative ATP-dependent endonuclease of the OLD family